jgi:hypothetical protein
MMEGGAASPRGLEICQGAPGHEAGAGRKARVSFWFPFRLWRFQPDATAAIKEFDAGLFERGDDLLAGAATAF